MDSYYPPQEANTVFKSYTITTSNNLSIISTPILEDAQEGYPISKKFQFKASGGQLPYEWKIINASLPNGIILNTSTGQLSGIPQTKGMQNFNIQLTDESGKKEYQQCSWYIIPKLKISTESLPDAPKSKRYQYLLQAKGGCQPYYWQLTGRLPAGLKLDRDKGIISGTPVGSRLRWNEPPFTLTITDRSPHPQTESKVFIV
ncbi:putative Ig [Candidatus Magnetomorum sp. HK-1]|nr:putative Ig [Candidatus Magnetomorum sp. HK-1]